MPKWKYTSIYIITILLVLKREEEEKNTSYCVMYMIEFT